VIEREKRVLPPPPASCLLLLFRVMEDAGSGFMRRILTSGMEGGMR